MATILLVEDSRPVRRMITTCVSVGVPGAHKILEAEDAAQGLDDWERRNGTVDLIITELSFCTGSMSGQDMIHLIRMRDPDVPIIVAASMDGESERDAVCGATCVFSKPFRIEEFMEAIRRALLTVETTVSE